MKLSILDFGAQPDGVCDSGPAIRAAIEAAREYPQPEIIFPAGRYRIGRAEGCDSGAMLPVEGFDRIKLLGKGAELIGTELDALFEFVDCAEVFVEGLKVDWDPLPFTAGIVVASERLHMDVKVAPGHPLLEKVVEIIATLNPETKAQMRPTDPGYFMVQQKRSQQKTERIAPDMLRIYRDEKPECLVTYQEGLQMPEVGSAVLAVYHARGGWAFSAHRCGRVHYKALEVYAVPGMALTGCDCDSVRIEDCKVMPRPGAGRWMSSTVDASHFNRIRERAELLGCTFELMGDDGSNVHGMYTMVHERPARDTIVLRGWGNPFENHGTENELAEPEGIFRPGDVLEFSDAVLRHHPVFAARVVAVSDVVVGGMTFKQVRLDAELPASIVAGTIVANVNNAPEFIMRRCTFRYNRGQGIRIQTRNALIEDCLFEDVHGNGIWIFCDADYGHESIAARNVVIRKSVFRRNASAVRSDAGRRPPVDAGVHEGLTIEDNRMEDCVTHPVLLSSVKGVVIRGNDIQRCGVEPIALHHCVDTVVEDNRIVS